MGGKIALVTGGTTGIGAATALRLRDEGATVVVTGTNPSTLEAAREEMPGIDVIASDNADVGATRSLMEIIQSRHGGLDILFANAGISRVAPLQDVDEAFFDVHFNVNVRGTFFMMQQAAKIMRDGGAMVLDSSVTAFIGTPGMSVYSATKAALRSFTRTFAAELAPRGIRVNAVCPGLIETPIFDKLGLSAEQTAGMKGQIAANIPLGRLGSAKEVADAVFFLASDQSSYVTGTELRITGGTSDI